LLEQIAAGTGSGPGAGAKVVPEWKEWGMNTRRWLACPGLLACGVLLSSLAPRSAGEELSAADAARKEEATKVSDAAAQIALAQDLIHRGRNPKAPSPLALLAAAEILGQIRVPVGELKGKPEITGEAPGKEEAPRPLLPPAEEAQNLVEEAKLLAEELVKKGDLKPAAGAAVQALAKEVIIEKSRGAIGGVKRKNGWLAPGQTATYRIDFNGLSLSRVFVFSEGRSPLQLTVSNTREQVRGEDTGWNPSASWMPGDRAGGVFLIRVTNVGDYGTPFRLVTN
jgi:hypothetical protein